MAAPRPRRPRESFAERRERHAAIEDPAVVLEAAARFLEVRPRSVSEVRQRLGTTGYRADLVDATVDRLLELEMLDDEAFAQTWVESRDRARPRGERAIREELRLKGVDRTVVEVVLDGRRVAAAERSRDVGDDAGPASDPKGADEAAAERLLAKHARALARVVDPRKRRQRAYALLARNGFDPETCRDVAARQPSVDPSPGSP